MTINAAPPIQLCLASRLYHPFYAGGALRFKRYLPGLQARNIQTRVFTGTPSRKRAQAFGNEISWQEVPVGTMMPVETIDGVPVHRLRLPDTGARRRDMQYARQLIEFCQQTEYQPDLIQFLPLQLWYVPALLRLRRSGIPTVAVYNLVEKRPSNSAANLLRKLYWRIPYQLVDCIIVNSRYMQDSLRQSGVTTRIEVIPNGVDLNRFCPDSKGENRRKIRQALGVKQDDSLIISVGAVEPRKGTDLLLEAWNQVSKTNRSGHLLIVGPRLDRQNPAFAPFSRKLESLITSSEAPEKIHFVGQVDNVEAYLQAADLFVFTSYREGLPNVVLEAMAVGLPVVTMPFVGLSDELGEADCHYCLVKRSSAALATTIQQLLNDPEARQLLGKAGRQWVKSQMDLEKTLDKLVELYNRLVHTH